MSCAWIYVSACLVFVSARIPSPHRTHPNPSAPNYTHIHPSLPQIPSLPSSCLFFHCPCMPKYVLRAHSRLFLSCFFSPPVTIHPIARILIHPYPSALILDHFCQKRTKHDVRGNFPGHGTQIRACETLNPPCLPCFCVTGASYAPTHPSAPIHIHSHLFLPV